MGTYASSLFSRPSVKICIIGLPTSGKTSVLYRLKLGKVVPGQPTLGFNVESVKYKDVKFEMWDLGGGQTIRNMHKQIYPGSHGFIYVVDSSDVKSMHEVKTELHTIFSSDSLKKIPILILANKKDIKKMSVEDITEKLELHRIEEHEWHVQESCVLTGEGLYEGLDWLYQIIQRKNN